MAARRTSGDNNIPKLNSVIRSFATNNDGNIKKGGGESKKRKKGGKKSRAARKREYLQRQEDAKSEEEEQMGNLTNATQLSNEICTNNEVENNTTLPAVEVIAPQRFLEDLEQALQEWLQQQEQNTINHAPNLPTPVATLQNLFQLRGQILTIESSLRKKCSLHKRHTLTGELRKCKLEWRELLSSIEYEKESQTSLSSMLAWSLSSTISSLDEDSDSSTTASLSPLPSGTTQISWEKLAPIEQEKLLLRWGKRRGRHGTRREKTEDRIVLAERLRRQLELMLDSDDKSAKDREEPTLVNLYADYINNPKTT